MGEAKRRAAAYEAAKGKLLRSLTGDGLVVAETAIKLFEGFIMPKRYNSGCYLASMVLHRFLKDERGIETELVIGYINDGTDDIFISHGWLEHTGLKTDVTINVTGEPEFRGPLIVTDEVLRPGNATYTYHRQPTAAGLRKQMEMLADPEIGHIAKHKAQEHLTMAARAKSRALIDAFLDSAPSQVGYEAMAEVLRR